VPFALLLAVAELCQTRPSARPSADSRRRSSCTRRGCSQDTSGQWRSPPRPAAKSAEQGRPYNALGQVDTERAARGVRRLAQRGEDRVEAGG
jgi:hypothetical protein